MKKFEELIPKPIRELKEWSVKTSLIGCEDAPSTQMLQDRGQIVCRECIGFGHTRTRCPTRRNLDYLSNLLLAGRSFVGNYRYIMASKKDKKSYANSELQRILLIWQQKALADDTSEEMKQEVTDVVSEVTEIYSKICFVCSGYGHYSNDYQWNKKNHRIPRCPTLPYVEVALRRCKNKTLTKKLFQELTKKREKPKRPLEVKVYKRRTNDSTSSNSQNQRNPADMEVDEGHLQEYLNAELEIDTISQISELDQKNPTEVEQERNRALFVQNAMGQSQLGITDAQKTNSENEPVIEFFNELLRVHKALIPSLNNGSLKLSAWPLEDSKSIVFVSFFEIENKLYVKFVKSSATPTVQNKKKFATAWAMLQQLVKNGRVYKTSGRILKKSVTGGSSRNKESISPRNISPVMTKIDSTASLNQLISNIQLNSPAKIQPTYSELEELLFLPRRGCTVPYDDLKQIADVVRHAEKQSSDEQYKHLAKVVGNHLVVVIANGVTVVK